MLSPSLSVATQEIVTFVVVCLVDGRRLVGLFGELCSEPNVAVGDVTLWATITSKYAGKVEADDVVPENEWL